LTVATLLALIATSLDRTDDQVLALVVALVSVVFRRKTAGNYSEAVGGWRADPTAMRLLPTHLKRLVVMDVVLVAWYCGGQKPGE